MPPPPPPSFTPSAQPSGGTCTLTVVVRDGRGGQATDSISLEASPPPPTSHFPPSGQKLAGGRFHSITLKPDGTVWTWGSNDYGQLGDTTWRQRHTPAQVADLTGVVAVDSRFEFTVALKSDGTVWAWGYNGFGQLGDGTWTKRFAPVKAVMGN
jgi:alpha-tubulin suppressor-like RCC1 family protein